MKSCHEIAFLVKVCGITNADDARLALEAGANALGFNFYRKSPRYLTIQEASEIADALPGNYLRVGVFVHPSLADIVKAARSVPLDVIQIHGQLPPNLPSGLRLWKAMAPAPEPEATHHRAEAYLLDTPSEQFGGTGTSFPWHLASGFRGRAILAGGLHGGNVEEAIAAAKPWGVDACSRLEASPGKKDPRLVREFVRAAFKAGVLEAVPSEITI